MKNKSLLIASVAFLGGAALAATLGMFRSENTTRPVIGRVENVYLEDSDLSFKARIDTGAGVSSLNAKIIKIKEPEKAGDPERVVFEVMDELGDPKTLEQRIVAWQEIKKKGSTGTSRRPVVMMDFCLGGRRVEGRVNLADRDAFLYPVLVGRNILKAGDFLIDPEKKFIGKAQCPSNK